MTESTSTEPRLGHVAAAPAQEGPRPKGLGPVGWLRWAWRQLTTMRTALILLFLVALGSVPGSFLPQRGQAPERVAEYYKNDPTLAEWLDRFSLFDVFAAPWFAAIYTLLFVSLSGCVIPRALQHYRAMRARPPKAPRNLERLPQSTTFATELEPAQAVRKAREVLRRRRFRVDATGGTVAAEKGYLGESGNLVFHLALLGLLFALGFGGTFGYRGDVLLTEGKTFANALNNYDRFDPGRQFDTGRLAPFTLSLDELNVKYHLQGSQRGQVEDYLGKVRLKQDPSAPVEHLDLRVNHPVSAGGAKVYLLGNGYAPRFTVRDAKGEVAFRDSVPFLPMEQRTMTSEGVVKAPDALPEQLAFYAVLWPTAVASKDNTRIESGFPGPVRPMVSITAFKGDIGLDKGDPQSVYRLDNIGKGLDPVKGGQKLLEPGETFQLPGGAGSITFDGLSEWGALSVNSDPGRVPSLVAAVLAVIALVTSFMVRRRRVWVRASAGTGGRTVVHVGGLTLGHPTGEFDDIRDELHAMLAAVPDPPDPDPGPEPEPKE